MELFFREQAELSVEELRKLKDSMGGKLVNKDNDINWLAAANELYEIQQKIKYLETQKKRVAQHLEELSSGQDSYGKGFEYKQITVKGVVDYKLIPELKDIDLEKYRKENISYWKLNFTKQYEF